MDIEKYIRELLIEQDCVIIPDFGGFIAQYQSADIHPIKHTLSPPSKHLVFNEMLKENDGLLVNKLALGEKVSRDEAATALNEYTSWIRTELKREKKYHFQEMGTLYVTPDNKLLFEAGDTVNFLEASFGLKDIQVSPVERGKVMFMPEQERLAITDIGFTPREKRVPFKMGSQTIEPVEPPASGPIASQDSGSSFSKVQAALIPVVLLLAVAFGYFGFIDNGQGPVSALNPFALFIPGFFDKKPPKPVVNIIKSDPGSPKDSASTDSVGSFSPHTFLQKPEPLPDLEQPKKSPTQEKEEAGFGVENTLSEMDKPTPTKPKLPSANQKNASQKKYYVIVGGFGSEANAQKLADQLIKEGFSKARVFPPGSNGLYKVASDEFDTEAQAMEEAHKLHERFSGAWVFKK
jgi:hypothetical protein